MRHDRFSLFNKFDSISYITVIKQGSVGIISKFLKPKYHMRYKKISFQVTLEYTITVPKFTLSMSEYLFLASLYMNSFDPINQ